MKIITNLEEVLKKHIKWINGDNDGERAYLREAYLRGVDLRGADLRGAEMCGADLRGADLRGVNLRRADLCGVDLCGADLSGANLYGASLYRADLSGADLSEADLSGADLSEADLRKANLRGANLYGADLREANLYGADLYKADLCEANLSGADLRRADLRGAKADEETITKFFPLCCPEEGSFIGWKKCRGGVIVKLQIPDVAKRSSAYGRKCRCSKAVVLEITDKDGKPLKTAKSEYDNEFVYTVGETVQPIKPFDEDRWHECASGIHFFITKQEAIDFE